MSYADQVPSFSGWVRNGAGRSRITYRRRKEHSAAPERVQKKKNQTHPLQLFEHRAEAVSLKAARLHP